MLAPPTRALLFAATSFTLGLLLAPGGTRPLWAVVPLIVAALMALFAHLRPTPAALRAALLLLLFFALGIVRGMPDPLPPLPEGRAWLEGRVLIPVEHRDDHTRVRLHLDRWSVGVLDGRLNTGAVAHLEGHVDVMPGERVRMAGTLEPFGGPRQPGGFDARAYWEVRGARLRIGQARALETLGVDGPGGWGLRTVALARAGIRKMVVDSALPGTTSEAMALMIGDRSAWDRSQRDLYARSGLMHLFAISGLHVALLAMILRAGLSLLSFVGSRTRTLITLGLLWFFVPLTGANPPVVRAAVMITLLVLGGALHRRNRIGYTLVLAWLLLLAWRPGGLHDAGFQLSFAGAAGAAYAGLVFRDLVRAGRKKELPRIWRMPYLWSRGGLYTLLVSTGAVAATAPIVILHFGRLPWFGPLATLAAGPLLTGALTAGWMMVITSWIPWLSDLFGHSLHAMVWTMERIARFTSAKLPVSEGLGLAGVVAALLAAATLAVLAPRMRRAPLPGAVLAVVSVAVLAVWASLWRGPAGPMLAVVDVGQGDGIVLRGAGRTVLIDGGPESNPAVVRLLRLMGVERLDLVVLTHGDADHAAALPRILETIPAERALIGPATLRDAAGRSALEALRAGGAQVFVGGAGTGVNMGPLGSLQVLSPAQDIAGNRRLTDNELSLVLLWSVSGVRALFPGDAGMRTEFRMLGEDAGTPVDLLLAGHHGSRHSTGAEWLELWRPERVIVSAGRHNPYGHPAPELLRRVQNAQAELLRTDREGTLFFAVRDSGIVRLDRPAVW